MNSRFQYTICGPQAMIAIKHADVTLRQGVNQQGETITVIEIHPQADFKYGRFAELLIQEAVLISADLSGEVPVFSFRNNIEEPE